MTLTEGGRRVAERPAFPVPIKVGDPGMTIHELVAKDMLPFAARRTDELGPVVADRIARTALDLADAYCNALAAREAGR